MMSHKRCIVLNPNAGRGLVRRQYDALIRMLRNAGLSFELVLTHARGEATHVTRQAIERGCDQIIVVGGDGTLYEVVNGIVAHHVAWGHSPSLGIIPMGTGNDFVKSLDGVPTSNLADTIRRLAAGTTRTIDVCNMRITGSSGTHETYFLNDLGVGIHALVAAEALVSTRLRGKAVYARAVVRALAAYRATPITVHFGGRSIHQPFFLVCAANGRCHGAGFWLTPNALLDDGCFDLCLIDMVPLYDILRFMPRVWKGQHTHMGQVTMGRAPHVVIDSATPLLVSADGEIICTDGRHIEANIVPHILKIIV